MIRIILNFTQIQGIISAYVLKNPDVTMNVLGFTFIGDGATLTTVPFRCVFGGKFTPLAIVTIFLPIAAPFISGFMLLIRKLIVDYHHYNEEDLNLIRNRYKPAFIRGIVVYLFFIHKDIVLTILRLFKTVSIQGESYLESDYNISAKSVQYKLLFSLGIIGCIFFAFGIPLMFGLILIRSKGII